MRAGPSHGPRPMGARGRAHRIAARAAARPPASSRRSFPGHTADPRPASLLDLGSASRRTAKAVTERSEGKGASDLDSRAAGATIIQVQGGAGPRAESTIRPLAEGSPLSSQFRGSPQAVGRSVVRPRTLISFFRSAPFITILDGAAITIFGVRQQRYSGAHNPPVAHFLRFLALPRWGGHSDAAGSPGQRYHGASQL